MHDTVQLHVYTWLQKCIRKKFSRINCEIENREDEKL